VKIRLAVSGLKRKAKDRCVERKMVSAPWILPNPQSRLRCRQSGTPRCQQPGCGPVVLTSRRRFPVRWDQRTLQCSSHNFTKCRSCYLTSLTMTGVGRAPWLELIVRWECLGEGIRQPCGRLGHRPSELSL